MLITGSYTNFVIGDEAGFWMNGKVVTLNVREYAPVGHPEFNYDVNFSREKVNVWAGLCGNGLLLGPFFFERNLNGIGYLQILNEQVIPELIENNDEECLDAYGGHRMALQPID